MKETSFPIPLQESVMQVRAGSPFGFSIISSTSSKTVKIPSIYLHTQKCCIHITTCSFSCPCWLTQCLCIPLFSFRLFPWFCFYFFEPLSQTPFSFYLSLSRNQLNGALDPFQKYLQACNNMISHMILIPVIRVESFNVNYSLN